MFKHYQQKKEANYLLWWLIGILTYGAGTFTESFNTLNGWTETNFRWWYITGALLGGAPLAQGSVYLLLKKRWANILSFMLIFAVLISSVFVLLSPINYALVEPTRMSGRVFVWQWVRYFSPFINLYAVVFLVGGAFVSAYKYFKKTGTGVRFWGNLLIAVGAILPGIGGSFTRLGYVEVLYVTEFMGLFIILIAYYMMKNEKVTSVHLNQI
ncbi:MAG: hypothetical protein ACKOWO_05005 [Sediminibacterium sp.]